VQKSKWIIQSYHGELEDALVVSPISLYKNTLLPSTFCHLGSCQLVETYAYIVVYCSRAVHRLQTTRIGSACEKMRFIFPSVGTGKRAEPCRWMCHLQRAQHFMSFVAQKGREMASMENSPEALKLPQIDELPKIIASGKWVYPCKSVQNLYACSGGTHV
jgi:hypothetical protein